MSKNLIEIHTKKETIELPIYYWKDKKYVRNKDNSLEVVKSIDRYDYNQMADTLENRIKKYLKRNVIVIIEELTPHERIDIDE